MAVRIVARRHHHRHGPARTALALFFAAVVAPAAAQVAPIKPGLWEVKMRQEEAGREQAGLAEELKKMPPAERKQFEAMMRKQGVDIGGGGTTMKVCYTREMLDADQWRDVARDVCKTEYLSRSSSRWTWRMTCSAPEPSVSDGEAVFPNAESYRMKVVTRKTGAAGKSGESKIEMEARWLGADCGQIKPFVVPGKGK